MATAKFTSATQNKIQSGQKIAGQVILTYDSQRMFWDVDDNTRIEITDIIELPDEAARLGLVSPLDKFYYVFTTGVLWRFHNTWTEVSGTTSGGGESSVISPTMPVGQRENDTWLEELP